MSKLLEHHVHTAFYRFLKDNHLLHHAQSGFRHLYCCETSLANIMNKWTKAIDEDLMNEVILLDLRKAFDLIDHQIYCYVNWIYLSAQMNLNLFSMFFKIGM